MPKGESSDTMATSSPVDRECRCARRLRQEVIAPREILPDCGLTEELKWGSPCYAHGGKNSCIIQRMKPFLAPMFFKGALLSGPDGMLERQGRCSRAGYRVRSASVQDVVGAQRSISSLALEAIEAERKGLTVEMEHGLAYVEELLPVLEEDPEFKAAFGGLTPGRQRGCVLHSSGARQSRTRLARIQGSRSGILAGKGIHDR